MAFGDGLNSIVNSLVTLVSSGKVNPNLTVQQGQQNIQLAEIAARERAAQAERTKQTLYTVGTVAIIAIVVIIGGIMVWKFID